MIMIKNVYMRKLSLFILTIVSMASLKAQDPHFSIFYGVPIGVNPAFTGNFNGNFRVSAQYRDQWNSVLSNESIAGYKTAVTSLEARTNKGIDENDFVGMGAYFMYDVAGQSRLSNTKLGLSASYRKALDQFGDHFIAIGGQAAFFQSKINLKDLTWGNQWNVDRYDPLIQGESANLDDNLIYYDFSTGISWGYNVYGTRRKFFAGLGLLHLNQPSFSFFRTGPNAIDATASLPMRINFNGAASFEMGNNLDIIPKVLYMKQGQSLETMFGADVRLIFDPSDDNSNSAYLGLMTRVVGGDPNKVLNSSSLNLESFVLTTRFDYNNMEIGAAYDFNVSDLSRASKYQGGFEVYMNYAFKIKNNKQRKMFCPKF
jgi:type IX secretion system PorP/SprF family membrane protein